MLTFLKERKSFFVSNIFLGFSPCLKVDISMFLIKNTESTFVSISSFCYQSEISYNMLETGYPDHFENSATYTCTIQQAHSDMQ